MDMLAKTKKLAADAGDSPAAGGGLTPIDYRLGDLSDRALKLVPYWDKLSEDQSERERKSGWDVTDRAIQDELIKRFPILTAPGALLLDGGPGPGIGSEKFRELGIDVIALDISPEMAKRAQASTLPFKSIVVADIAKGINRENAGVEPNSLNGILFIGSPQSFVARGPNPGDYDIEAFKVILDTAKVAMKEEAPIVLCFPHMGIATGEAAELEKVRFGLIEKEGVKPMHENTTPLNPVTLRQQLIDAGFEIVTDDMVKNAYDNPQCGKLDYWLLVGVKK